MNDLDSKILKVEKWKETQRVIESAARVTISAERIVFFTVNVPNSGNFSDIVDLAHCSEKGLEREMEVHLKHIEQVAKNFFRP